jgi:CMP-N-acetylneuraminic acid synthetase
MQTYTLKKMRKYNITCIIPARKNSKGLINKNIKKINGKELILYPFEVAQKSKYIKNIIFTSDSKKYINIINKNIFNKKKNFFFIHRPLTLSKDKTPTSSVIIHSLQTCFPKTTHIVLLEPTSPLTQTKDIDKAIQILIRKSKKADSIISVISNFKFSSSYDIKISRNNFCTFKKDIIKRRQKIKKNFYLSGNFYISKKKSFFQYKSFYTKKTLAYEVSRNCYTDIDDKTDLVIARSLYDQFILKKNEF